MTRVFCFRCLFASHSNPPNRGKCGASPAARTSGASRVSSMGREPAHLRRLATLSRRSARPRQTATRQVDAGIHSPLHPQEGQLFAPKSPPATLFAKSVRPRNRPAHTRKFCGSCGRVISRLRATIESSTTADVVRVEPYAAIASCGADANQEIRPAHSIPT
jgi:hypothetical protein